MLVCRKLIGPVLLALLVLGLVGNNTVCSAQAQAPGGEAVPELPPSPRGAPLRPLPNEWTPGSIAYLKASNSRANAQFGYVVAMSSDGSTMAVGAIGEDSPSKGINSSQQGPPQAVNSGAVYVYTRKGNSWVQQAYVKASNTKVGQQFGSSLALSADGNTMAVGAIGEASSSRGVNGNQDDESMPGAGAVYVFTRTDSTWSQQSYVKASNTGEEEDGDQFGYAVTLSSDGNTMAVSAISEDGGSSGINGDQKSNSADGAGAVYIFGRSGNTWSQQAYVKPWNTTVRGGLFGYSVGLSGNGETLAVGSYDEERGRGAIYIFTRNGNAWSQQMRLQALNREAGDSLGCSVSVSEDGNTVLAGAFDEDSILRGLQPPTEGTNDAKSDVSTGAVYVFVRKGTEWSEQAFIKSTNTRLNDQFGWALALSRDGNTMAVGSHLEDSGSKGLNGDQENASAEDSGSVYIYKRFNTTWLPVAYVKAPNPQEAAEFGISVSLSGDGKMLAVGAFKENGSGTGVNSKATKETATESGAAYVYY